jgi:predicted lipoprotein with Yx(FWY)xxD motif
MRTRTLSLLSIALLGSGALLAGCGTDSAPEEGAPPAEESAPADDTAAPDGGMAGEATVATAESDLGTILVDGEGMTLYLFTKDSPGTSVCVDDCLVAWPALEGEPTAGDGVDESLLGSIERDDGTVQATYDEMPLYYFAQDAAPGDVTGQGVNEVWYVLSPDGEAIMEAPTMSPTGAATY